MAFLCGGFSSCSVGVYLFVLFLLSLSTTTCQEGIRHFRKVKLYSMSYLKAAFTVLHTYHKAKLPFACRSVAVLAPEGVNATC